MDKVKLPILTTSELSSVPADIRVCLTRTHPLKFKRLFLGLHIDFSTHQLLLYMGFITLFVEIYGINRNGAVKDRRKSIWKLNELELLYHDSNYSKHFFNIGMTIYTNYIILFLWQLQLWIPIRKDSK